MNKISNINKMLFFILLIIMSCVDSPKKFEEFDFIIKDKVSLNNKKETEYFLKDKDTIIQVNAWQYVLYEESDTLKLKKALDGFYKGAIYLDK